MTRRVVELEQWTDVGRSSVTDCVTVELGGRVRDHLHPSRQVAQYQRYLQDTHPAFYGDAGIDLDACAYLHNAVRNSRSPIYDATFATLLAANPPSPARIETGWRRFSTNGSPVRTKATRSSIGVAATVSALTSDCLTTWPVSSGTSRRSRYGRQQLVAYNAIIDEVRGAGENQGEVVFLVKGGPRHR